MGQQLSQEKEHDKEKERFVVVAPQLCGVEREIEKLREDLQTLKQEGKRARKLHQEEIHTLKSDLQDTIARFQVYDEQATSLRQFWEYLDIIRQEENKFIEQEQEQEFSISQVRQAQSSLRMAAASTSSKNASVTYDSNKLIPSCITLSNSSIISTLSNYFYMDLMRLLKARLLRKLHLAMTLQRQQRKQEKSWNKLILFYFHQAQNKVGVSMKEASRRASEMLQESKARRQERENLNLQKVRIQENLIGRLQQAIRRSSITQIRNRKRELEFGLRNVSPLQGQQRKRGKVVIGSSWTIRMIPSIASREEEGKEEEDGSPLSEQRRRRSSIKEMKSHNRQLEQKRFSDKSCGHVGHSSFCATTDVL